MLNMDQKLLKREEEGKIIRTGIVGAGQMGRGMVTQMAIMKGISPAIVSNIKLENVINAFHYAGITDDQIVVAKTLEEANKYMEMGKYVATENSELISQANLVECAIDVTGVPEVGVKIAIDSMNNGKHVVMMDVETDVVIGPYLKKLGEKNNVIYTGSAGDEPGTVMELYSFAKAMGMQVKVMGKGKNNKLDYACNPDTVLPEATRRKMSPRMLCAFKDGTKTMVEMTAMSNATGLIPDIIGGHGPSASPAERCKELNSIFRLKKDGGILNKHGVVEYVNGIAPGVFVTIATENAEIAYQMQYHSMGPGPLWTLYRPYHLCNLETPLTVAKAVIDREPTIIPIDGPVSECITVAKKDLKAGEYIDGIGGYTTYGSIATAEETRANGYVVYGLINKKSKMKKDVKKGQLLTLSDVELDTSTQLYNVRKEQDDMYRK
ncbi:NAD(P)H-dependent oxidoreductase [Pectinatus cerevisiiphilus]|uniref:Putative homoserine dehydrogenase-like protein n=1 Tax=Pectinatus cerevisiiphilus TaxID=86956 RepID=A0A4R3K521_9FIRM|nr:NAD(P)-dependent oxidoreductase [Pectinatus cerevisiiphilus]TCS77797.1 putative homoserine dehydrogenase-like protein [Pectinatus cerevisiiphilus]